MTEIWHNPQCSKSREALALLQARGIEPTVIRYLDTPPTPARLREVIQLLGGAPMALVRKKEPLFRESGLGPDASVDEVIAALAAHPRLIERPVVITEKGARIGRPTESVLEVL